MSGRHWRGHVRRDRILDLDKLVSRRIVPNNSERRLDTGTYVASHNEWSSPLPFERRETDEQALKLELRLLAQSGDFAITLGGKRDATKREVALS